MSDHSTSSGYLSEKKAVEIDKIYVAQAGRLSQSPLPRLDRILETVGDQKLLILDCKEGRFFNADFAQVIIDSIRKYKLQNTVIVASFNPMLLYNIRRLDPEISIMYTFESNLNIKKFRIKKS